MYAGYGHDPHDKLYVPGVRGCKRLSMLDCPIDERNLRELFERDGACTFGAEEELMIIDPQTLDLAPRAMEISRRAAGTVETKLELPASQLELVTEPHESVAELVDDLSRARRHLAQAVLGEVRLLACGVHPFAAARGELNVGERYERIQREYGPVARRQLVCGLHVHVAVRGADRALAVYNAIRSYLPELAALAANAAWYEGRDSGMASVRPLISGTLPRQGVPPAYATWREFADDLSWGVGSGRLSSPREWWWELRLHPQLGTLEVRAPDSQSRVEDAAAIIATVCVLVLWLLERHDAGELPSPAPSWRIAENRWSAARHGIDGEMVDLWTGAASRTRERLHSLLNAIAPLAPSIGAGAHLRHAHALAEHNGASRQRAIAKRDGAEALVDHLASVFVEPLLIAGGGHHCGRS